MVSRLAEAKSAPSGLVMPPGTSRACCLAWFRRTRKLHVSFRVGAFTLGLLLIIAAAALWLLSVFLAAPPAFAGLWVWSREFHWGHRLLRGFLRRAHAGWQRVRKQPARWTVVTLTGLVAGWAVFWAWGHYGS